MEILGLNHHKILVGVKDEKKNLGSEFYNNHQIMLSLLELLKKTDIELASNIPGLTPT